MKKILLGLLLFSAFNPQLSTLLAQGSLTPPPGTPAPTMKTLDQVEARKPISSAPFSISASGSYYLTNNLSVTSGDAITISVNNVTLDLNGFTISSTDPGNSGRGIYLTGASGNVDVTILNGHIKGNVTNSGGTFSGNGFGSGIEYVSTPSNVQVSGVSVSGCLYNGIHLGNNNATVIESCTARQIGGYGLWAATVSHSAAYQCGSAALYGDTVSDSYGDSTAGYGVYAGNAHNCQGASGTGTGVNAIDAQNCVGFSNGGGRGINASVAGNCYGQSFTGAGVYVNIGNNCQGISTSGNGLYAVQSANNCYGSNGGPAEGLFAFVATNCSGLSGSGIGLSSVMASNSRGQSTSGTGLFASTAAITCWGQSSSFTGLNAFIANSCGAFGNPALLVTHQYNMPP